MQPRIFTIGHSNQSMDRFLALLEQNHVDVLVDVRSSPYSKYAKHFNQENLKPSVLAAGRKYLYLGAELGGMPKDRSLYDDSGHVMYSKIAESEQFKHAISRLEKGVVSYTVALMCGEENPTNCHRRRLLAPALKQLGIEVLHIRGNGTVQSDEEIESSLLPAASQLTLFASDEP